MRYHFFALISRMRHIFRWGLMRNAQSENLLEHSYMTAVFAHALSIIRSEVFGLPSDPGAAAVAALFHDAVELFTGDLPTPVKYFDTDIRASYKKVEASAAKRLAEQLPPPFQKHYVPLLEGHGGGETDELVRAADKLAAYVKCVEELRMGNREFSLAASQIRSQLHSMGSREVEWFLDRFSGSFGLSLDELQQNEAPRAAAD